MLAGVSQMGRVMWICKVIFGFVSGLGKENRTEIARVGKESCISGRRGLCQGDS
jgi:hypothetical protein